MQISWEEAWQARINGKVSEGCGKGKRRKAKTLLEERLKRGRMLRGECGTFKRQQEDRRIRCGSVSQGGVGNKLAGACEGKEQNEHLAEENRGEKREGK